MLPVKLLLEISNHIKSAYLEQCVSFHCKFISENIGIAAEEVLYACEQNEGTSTSSEVGLANPAVHFIR